MADAQSGALAAEKGAEGRRRQHSRWGVSEEGQGAEWQSSVEMSVKSLLVLPVNERASTEDCHSAQKKDVILARN